MIHQIILLLAKYTKQRQFQNVFSEVRGYQTLNPKQNLSFNFSCLYLSSIVMTFMWPLNLTLMSTYCIVLQVFWCCRSFSLNQYTLLFWNHLRHVQSFRKGFLYCVEDPQFPYGCSSIFSQIVVPLSSSQYPLFILRSKL